MRKLLLALLVQLPACLEYEIVVTTIVQPGGIVRRTLAIREKAEKKTWARLRSPAEPYRTEGDDEKGFEAKAELKAGRHPSGLAVLLGEADKNPPVAEGTVSVEAKDLLVATVYRYEERIAIGADPARFRKELPKWLDLALGVALDTLRTAFPEIDFAPVEAKARAEFLPAAERAIVAAFLACQAAVAEGRARGSVDADVIAVELLRVVVHELEPLGVSIPVDLLPVGPEWNADAAAEKAGRQMVEKLLSPLDEAQRARVIEAIFSGDALEQAAEEAGKRLCPTENAKERLGRDAQAFAASALGAYVAYGIFDSFDMSFRVELPGRLLRANGELSRLPGVAWRLEQGDLVLAAPVLTASSFETREGVAGEGWDGETLSEIEKALAEVPPEQRPALEAVVEKAIRVGWPEDPPLEDEATIRAYCILRDAARPPKPPPDK